MVYMGLPLKNIQQLQLVQNAAAQLNLGVSYYTHITLLLCKPHWLPVGYQAQCKVLVITNKALHLLFAGPPLVPAQPTISGREDILRVPSIKLCHLVGPRSHAFPMAVPVLWNSIPPEVQMAPTLLAFCKALKTKLLPQALGQEVRQALLVMLFL